jgi:hypothetical protein
VLQNHPTLYAECLTIYFFGRNLRPSIFFSYALSEFTSDICPSKILIDCQFALLGLESIADRRLVASALLICDLLCGRIGYRYEKRLYVTLNQRHPSIWPYWLLTRKENNYGMVEPRDSRRRVFSRPLFRSQHSTKGLFKPKGDTIHTNIMSK